MTSIDEKLALLQECNNFIKGLKQGGNEKQTDQTTSYLVNIFLIVIVFILAFVYIKYINTNNNNIKINEINKLKHQNNHIVDYELNNKNPPEYIEYISRII